MSRKKIMSDARGSLFAEVAARAQSPASPDFVRSLVQAQSAPVGDAEPASADRAPEAPSRLPVARLRFHADQQPRDMLPAEEWATLEADGHNDPASVLAALQAAALARVGSQRVLDHVEELAESIRTEGVLMPLSVVAADEAYTVVDGHCRAMAAVLAGAEEVPVRLEAGAEAGAEAELTRASHRFVLNFTQQRLTPLESMREVVRIVALARQVVLARLGQAGARDEEAGESAANANLADDGEPFAEEDIERLLPAADVTRRPGQTRSKAIERAIQSLVLARTGLSLKRYTDLYRLRHLHPEAQELAEGLSEGHLIAVLAAPTDLQPLLVRLVRATNASVRETRHHAEAARRHGAEFLRDLYDRLVRPEAPRQRAPASWEPLMRPLPDNLSQRISALRAELAALPDAHRDARLRSLLRQRQLYAEALHAFDEILAGYSIAPDARETRDHG